MTRFFSGSVTIIHCQPWALLPVGAWMATSRPSISRSRETGRSKSCRFRTERVVVRMVWASMPSIVAARGRSVRRAGVQDDEPATLREVVADGQSCLAAADDNDPEVLPICRFSQVSRRGPRLATHQRGCEPYLHSVAPQIRHLNCDCPWAFTPPVGLKVRRASARTWQRQGFCLVASGTPWCAISGPSVVARLPA